MRHLSQFEGYGGPDVRGEAGLLRPGALGWTGEGARPTRSSLLQGRRWGWLLAGTDVVTLQLAIEGGTADAEHFPG